MQRGVRDGVPQLVQLLQLPEEAQEADGGAGEELDPGEAEPLEQEEAVCQEQTSFF